jgi:hypothetical protein
VKEVVEDGGVKKQVRMGSEKAVGLEISPTQRVDPRIGRSRQIVGPHNSPRAGDLIIKKR